MKYFYILLCLISITASAQNPCEFDADVKDSVGTYKSTKEYLVYERNFAGNFANMQFSIALTDGMPTLNMQYIQKSKDFIKANCLDKNSRIYLQLNNGKIVTLIHIDTENCGTSVRDDKGYSHRIMQGIFMFMKDSFNDLKSSPVSVMRIKYTTETVDYIFKEALKSEADGKIYKPESYFMTVLPCLDN